MCRWPGTEKWKKGENFWPWEENFFHNPGVALEWSSYYERAVIIGRNRNKPLFFIRLHS
jgi:hypothetical protein